MMHQKLKQVESFRDINKEITDKILVKSCLEEGTKSGKHMRRLNF